MGEMTLAGMVEALAVQTVEGEKAGDGMLEQLRKAVFGDVGGTVGGARKIPVPLNLGAFQVWEDIAGQIAAQFHGATLIRPNKSPVVNLLAWYGVFSAASDRGDVTDLQQQVMLHRVQGWVNTIQNQLMPPRVKELMISCPECGVYRVLLGEGEEQVESQAVVIPLDGELSATCRACGHRWVGDVEVIQLGRLAGMPIDPEAIREAKRPDTPEPAVTG